MPLILHSSNCSPHCCDTWRFPQLGLWRHVNWSLWWRQIDVSCTGRQPELHTHTCVDAWHTSDILRTNMIVNRLGLSRLCQLNNSLLHITCDRLMTKSICSHSHHYMFTAFFARFYENLCWFVSCRTVQAINGLFQCTSVFDHFLSC